MTRNEIYSEIKEMFGMVPTFIKELPDSTLEMEWHLMKRIEFDEGPIPNKYRELISLGIAAATRCRYCSLFHTEAARLNGATDAEIESAVHIAKSTVGWSTYVNGMQIDYEQFRKEVAQMTEFARKHHMAAA